LFFVMLKTSLRRFADYQGDEAQRGEFAVVLHQHHAEAPESHSSTPSIFSTPSSSRQGVSFLTRGHVNMTPNSTPDQSPSNSGVSQGSPSLDQGGISTNATTMSSSPERHPRLLVRLPICVCLFPPWISGLVPTCDCNVCFHCRGHSINSDSVVSLLSVPGHCQCRTVGPNSASLYFLICGCDNGTGGFCDGCGGYPISHSLVADLQTKHNARLEPLV
jgi:hypothetical protein